MLKAGWQGGQGSGELTDENLPKQDILDCPPSLVTWTHMTSHLMPWHEAMVAQYFSSWVFFDQCAFTLVWSPYLFLKKIFCPQTIAVTHEWFWPYLCKNVTSMSHMATLPDWSSNRHIQHEVKGQRPNLDLLTHFLVDIFNSHLLAHHTSAPLAIWFLVLSNM